MVYFLGRDCAVYITVEQPSGSNVEGVFVVNAEPAALTTDEGGAGVDYAFAYPLGSGTSAAAVADLVGVDFIPAKDREKEKPLFIEVNSNPGLMGIEKTLSKNNFTITEEILKHFMNRENWRI